MIPGARYRRGRQFPDRWAPAPGGSPPASRYSGWPPGSSPAEHPALGLKKLRYAMLGEIEQDLELAPAEGGVLSGPLHLHELRRLHHHDIGIYPGVLVFRIGQIEPQLAFDHPH